MNDVTIKETDLPAMMPFDDVERGCRSIREQAADVRTALHSSLNDARTVLQGLRELALRIPSIRQQLALANQPATKDDIVRELSKVIASKPDDWNRSSGNGNQVQTDLERVRKAWGQLFIEEAASLRPSVGALMIGCRNARRARGNNEFQNRRLPSPDDIAHEIRSAALLLRTAEDRLGLIPEDILSLEARIGEMERFRLLKEQCRTSQKGAVQ